jgi:hypothetical protein
VSSRSPSGARVFFSARVGLALSLPKGLRDPVARRECVELVIVLDVGGIVTLQFC